MATDLAPVPNGDASQLPMRCSATIATLVTALAKAQGQFPDVGKDKIATIVTKGGTRYSYAYADLATVLSAVRRPLAENELAVLQPVHVNSGSVSVTTVLAHSSGEWVSDALALPVGDATDARSLASAITYARRYGLIALLGLAPGDEDDDAAAATAKPMSQAAPRPIAPPEVGPAAPAPDLPSGVVRVVRVETVPLKGKEYPQYRVTLSTGDVLTTLKRQLGVLADAVCQAQEPVRVEIEQKGQYQNLVGIKRLETNDQQPEFQQLTDEDIPF